MTRSPATRFGLALALWLCASSVLAQTKVVVRKFDGPKSAKIREAVVDALQGEVELVESGRAESAGDLSTEEGRVSAARELEVSAFIEGSVDKGRNWTLTLTVYNGADGSSLGETEIKGSANALPGKVKRNGWDALGPLVAQGAVPAAAAAAAVEPEPEPEPEQEAEPEPEEEEEPGEEDEPESDSDSDLHALDFSVGLRLQTRDFSYKDAFPGLRDYELGLSPNLYLEGHWYPGAHVSDGVAAWFGLELRGQFMLGVDSENTAGEKFPTSSNAFGVGLRFRVPLGKHEIALLAGYGTHSFTVDSSEGGVDPDVPDLAYGFVRLGADTRLVLGSLLRLEARVAYLPLLSFGGIAGQTWFPHTSGSGVEADLLIGIAVVKWLELNVGGGLVRYGLSFDPEVDDPGVVNSGRVAGGALDQYYSLRFGATLRL